MSSSPSDSPSSKDASRTQPAAALPAEALTLVQLLCTRLCHDLAGPIGAVNTGAELLEDMSGEPVDAETLALLADSARSAAARLKALRLAMGVAKGSTPSLAEAMSVLSAHLAAGGKALQADLGALPDPGPAAVQALLNLAMVAGDAWPRATRVAVSAPEGTVTCFTVSVDTATPLSAPWQAALAGTLDEAEPRTAQAVLAGHLVMVCGAALRVEAAGPGVLEMRLA